MKKTIYLAGGCFWGVQAYFERVNGVLDTMVGYCNGNTAFPKYEDLKQGKSTHAETVKVDYDDEVISLTEILRHFLNCIDPYSLDKQGEDIGHQYRTGVYYRDLLDGMMADSFFSSNLKPGYKIEIVKMMNFFPAEEYHQHYLDKNPGGYCHVDLSKASKK